MSNYKLIHLPADLPSIPQPVDPSAPQYTAPHEIAFLCWCAQHCPGNVLEIGCNYGRTTQALARTNPSKTVYAVDRTTISGLAPEQIGETPVFGLAGRLAWKEPNVALFNLPNGITPELISELKVGMVFIDGDHAYEGVKRDTDALLDADVRGLFVWHDYDILDNPDRKWIEVRRYVDTLSLSPLYVLENSTAACAWIARGTGPDFLGELVI